MNSRKGDISRDQLLIALLMIALLFVLIYLAYQAFASSSQIVP